MLEIVNCQQQSENNNNEEKKTEQIDQFRYELKRELLNCFKHIDKRAQSKINKKKKQHKKRRRRRRPIDRSSLSSETKHIIFIDRTEDGRSDRCASEQLYDITLNYKITGQPTSIDRSWCAVRHLFTKSIYKSSPRLIAATIPILCMVSTALPSV